MEAIFQGVHLLKEATIFMGPLILVKLVSGLHKELDQLENEVTTYSGDIWMNQMFSTNHVGT